MQVICRLADRIGLPNRAQLEAYYGGEALMPARPWGAYWLSLTTPEPDTSRGRAAPATAKTDPRSQPGVTVEIPAKYAATIGQRIARRASAEHVLSVQTLPLAEKLTALCDVIVCAMMRSWGGSDMAACTARMMATAKTVSGGIEMG